MWTVPVGVRFSGVVAPPGVARLYQDLTLAVRAPSGGQPGQIVGEGPASLDAPIIQPGVVPSRTVHVPILMYHRVGPLPIAAQHRTQYGYQLAYELTVPPGQFSSEMAALVAAHASAISLARLSDALLYGLPLPPRAVVITFDDGRLSPLTYAVPILRRDGFTATFFVPAGLVGRTVRVQHYVTWAEVSQLANSGFWVEDHTLFDSIDLWGLSAPELQPLVKTTAETLMRHTGRAVQFIAYSGAYPLPSAAQAGPAEVAVFHTLASMGYVGGVLDQQVQSSTETTAGLWQLPRLRMFPGESAAGFAYALAHG